MCTIHTRPAPLSFRENKDLGAQFPWYRSFVCLFPRFPLSVSWYRSFDCLFSLAVAFCGRSAVLIFNTYDRPRFMRTSLICLQILILSKSQADVYRGAGRVAWIEYLDAAWVIFKIFIEAKALNPNLLSPQLLPSNSKPELVTSYPKPQTLNFTFQTLNLKP